MAHTTGSPTCSIRASSSPMRGKPWQRGTNENTNGLLRQYFPKRADLSGYSAADLAAVEERLNNRPRKALGFLTPAQVFAAAMASL
jgi:IS30 family transposase